MNTREDIIKPEKPPIMNVFIFLKGELLLHIFLNPNFRLFYKRGKGRGKRQLLMQRGFIEYALANISK